MKDKNNTRIWTNSGFIGHQLLTSNSKESCHHLVFLGAEELMSEGLYKLNFMMSQQFATGGCSVPFTLVISEDETLRFERFWGIHREITVEYAPEDYGCCQRFLSAKSIKFLEIKKDFIKYEISCY